MEESKSSLTASCDTNGGGSILWEDEHHNLITYSSKQFVLLINLMQERFNLLWHRLQLPLYVYAICPVDTVSINVCHSVRD